MSRMAKDRGEAKTGSSAERGEIPSRAMRDPQIQEGEFVRAFADALQDILLHDRTRSRHATAR
jgi:hypothetical protein